MATLGNGIICLEKSGKGCPGIHSEDCEVGARGQRGFVGWVG
jgi:hypothetical protein